MLTGKAESAQSWQRNYSPKPAPLLLCFAEDHNVPSHHLHVKFLCEYAVLLSFLLMTSVLTFKFFLDRVKPQYFKLHYKSN